MAKPISVRNWEAYLRARQVTGSCRRQSLAKGFLTKFAAELTEEQKERLRYLDRHATAYDVRDYIEEELVEK